MSMRIELKKQKEILIVRLHGELDHHTSESVRERIDDALQNDRFAYVVLNLRKLTFMDSSGLGIILGRYKRINEQGGKLAVCSLHPSVHKLFELSGMFKIISVYDEEKDALASSGVTS